MSETPSPPVTPLLIRVAAATVGLQGLAALGFGVAVVLGLTSDRVEAGLSVAVFFVAAGAALTAVAVGLGRSQSWARGPALAAELIALGVAWGVRDLLALAVALAVTALVALASLLHPSSVAALNRE